MLLACVAAAGAAQPAPLTTLDSVRRLSNAEAAKGIPVAVTATVTYFRSYRKNMFVQDGATGLFVKATTNVTLVPGDRVLIKGVTHEGYLPEVVSSDLTLLGHGALPKPIAAGLRASDRAGRRFSAGDRARRGARREYGCAVGRPYHRRDHQDAHRRRDCRRGSGQRYRE